jgi:hypothetical protein
MARDDDKGPYANRTPRCGIQEQKETQVRRGLSRARRMVIELQEECEAMYQR